MNASYLTIDELKTVYAADLDYEGITDTTISGAILAASRRVDSYTDALRGWDFEAVVDEEYDSDVSVHTDADSNLVIPLIKRPLSSIESVEKISIRLGAAVSDLMLKSGDVPVLHSPYPNWSIIYPGNFLASVGTLLGQQRLYNLRSYHYFVRVSYSGGYENIPEDMKQATALFVRNALAQRYNPSGAIEERQGSVGLRFADGFRQKNQLITEAESLLNKYVRVA